MQGVKFAPEVLDRLLTEIREDLSLGFVNMWRQIVPNWDDMADDSIAPWDYALDRDQQEQLLEAAKAGCVDRGEDTWTAMGLFLNNGPSSQYAG